MIRLQAAPFEPGALLSAFSAGRPDIGAVVSFTGVVRADQGEGTVLELEAYAGFTESEIARIAEAAKARFKLVDYLIVHRHGRIEAGEPVVFVAAAAAHRREAFEGADHLMDYLKSRAPFWKKEHGPGGARWGEPRAEDHADVARWEKSGA